MNKALLSQDYHDAGANRVVSVLEEIREGILRKLEQQSTIRADLNCDDTVFACDVRRATYKAVADDIACFIQREQRHV